MYSYQFSSQKLVPQTEALELSEDRARLLVPGEGGGLVLTELAAASGRYLGFYVTVMADHSLPLNFHVYRRGNKAEPRLTIRFGVLDRVRTFVRLDLDWLGAGQLFPEPTVGGLKIVCHGGRVEREEIERIELVTLPSHHELQIEFESIRLYDSYPESEPLADLVMVDRFGQNARRDWPGKIRDEETLGERLREQAKDAMPTYPTEDWTPYGGWQKKRLTQGSGYFATYKEGDKWWLVDPDGYAFFSVGPNCVNVITDCRVDAVSDWLEWLPSEDDPIYGSFYDTRVRRQQVYREFKSFDYRGANLYKVFGQDWYKSWQKLIAAQLKSSGMNTIANWSDTNLYGTAKLPYVSQLPQFPTTTELIFRDFPDVFSPEYEENAALAAKALEPYRDDPYMIGYFLRNEPEWAFVDNLILAEEVLYNETRTVTKERLILSLQEQYETIDRLNDAWHTTYADFSALYSRQRQLAERSPQAKTDLIRFSRQMLQAYIDIPAKHCREVDPNHMILGMRWAWISDKELITGWENFDVFSINCYAVDPTSAIQNVIDLGVDLPVMIGEFHFGALDRGLTATGLEGVETEADRGIAYQYYTERVAAHTHGVGCHYFQCYDQFYLGRFDGENYNIGMFDICSLPHSEMLSYFEACSERIYDVANGTLLPTNRLARSIPMIAY